MADKILNTESMHLADICADCLMLTLQLRAAREYGDPKILREKILQLLDKIEREARQHEYSLEDIQRVKFALVAFLDESIIASDWSQKDSWLSKPLQLQLYDRFDAGEEFYNKLDAMLDEIQLNTEVLEVYYLCLTLGFKGKYGVTEQEKQRVIVDDIYHELKLSNFNKPDVLSPNGDRKEEIREIIQSEIPYWTIGVGTAVTGLLIYFIFSIFSTNIANSVINQFQMVM